MCTYFISDLSAKEIGLLMNLSDVSVRVAKNKIKNKIGLDKDANLDDYLKSISI
jgi:DNA-binding NarL/FixJ family response regulator